MSQRVARRAPDDKLHGIPPKIGRRLRRITPSANPLYRLRATTEPSMSLSSAKNYALRAAKSQDQKEATELLSKAIMELTLAIEATDAKIKKMNKVQ
jgi:hypothetical protein